MRGYVSGLCAAAHRLAPITTLFYHPTYDLFKLHYYNSRLFDIKTGQVKRRQMLYYLATVSF